MDWILWLTRIMTGSHAYIVSWFIHENMAIFIWIQIENCFGFLLFPIVYELRIPKLNTNFANICIFRYEIMYK